MKFKIYSLLLSITAALWITGAQKADAFEFRIGVDNDRHYHTRDHVEYRTIDPTYSTWYPTQTTTVYNPPTYYSNGTTYYSNGTTYTTTPTYIYPQYQSSVEYNTWYGDGRRYNHDRHDGRRR